MFASLGLTAAINEVISRGGSLNAFAASLRRFFIAVLTVALSSSAILVISGGVEVASDWGNLGFLLRADFLPFFFACLEATDPISWMCTFADMFNVLKGLEMFYSTAMPVRYYSLHGSLTCFGVTVRSSRLKLYWVTSDIASYIRSLVSRSSAPSSISFPYRKWGTWLQTSEQLIVISGRLSAKIVPDFA